MSDFTCVHAAAICVCVCVQVGAADVADVAAVDAEAAGSSQELDPEEARRQDVLQRLQGKDTQLESGLRVRQGSGWGWARFGG